MDSDFKAELFIDKYSLDQECVDQPYLYMKYGELHAEAIKERDVTKERLDIERAKLYGKIREDPKAYCSTEKPTESAISNVIVKNESVLKLTEVLREENYKVNVFQAAREAFTHRKKSLENLVELYLTSYFSQPKVGNQRENVNKDNREVQKEIKSKLNLKRRKRN